MATLSVNPALNPHVWCLPATGNPTLMKVSDAKTQGQVSVVHGEAWANEGWAYSGLHLIPEQSTFYATPYPVDPENPPENMTGYWEGLGKDEEDTSDYSANWNIDLSVIVDGDGRLKTNVPNESAPQYVGKVFIVKRLFNTETSSEVSLNMDATDLAILRDKFRHANFSA